MFFIGHIGMSFILGLMLCYLAVAYMYFCKKEDIPISMFTLFWVCFTISLTLHYGLDWLII